MGSSSYPRIVGGTTESEFVGCRVTNNATQSIPSSTYTAVLWQLESYDTHGFHDTSSNTSRLTVPAGKGGRYLVWAGVNWENGLTFRQQGKLYKNGSGDVFLWDNQFSGGYQPGTHMTVMDLSPGDYIELFMWQSQGTPQNLWSGGNEFGCVRLGSAIGGTMSASNYALLTQSNLFNGSITLSGPAQPTFYAKGTVSSEVQLENTGANASVWRLLNHNAQGGDFVLQDSGSGAIPFRAKKGSAGGVVVTGSQTNSASLSFEGAKPNSTFPYEAVIDESTTNYVTNPSFEVDTAGWTNQSGTAGRSTSEFYIGAASGTVTASVNGTGIYTEAAVGIVAQNQSWTASMWFKNTTGRTFRLSMYTNSGSVLVVEKSVVANGAWQRIVISGTIANASPTNIRLYLNLNDGIGTSTTFYVDGIQLEQKTYSTTYCDGSLGAGYSWSGTAHSSTSARTAGFKYLGAPSTGQGYPIGRRILHLDGWYGSLDSIAGPTQFYRLQYGATLAQVPARMPLAGYLYGAWMKTQSAHTGGGYMWLDVYVNGALFRTMSENNSSEWWSPAGGVGDTTGRSSVLTDWRPWFIAAGSTIDLRWRSGNSLAPAANKCELGLVFIIEE